MDNHGRLVAGRLHTLAAGQSTGVLPFSGPSEGTITVAEGAVASARARLTPAGPAIADASQRATRLGTLLDTIEPTMDAALELLSGPPGSSKAGRFRPVETVTRDQNPGPGYRISVADLIAEVERRQAALGRMSAELTPDTPVTLNPGLGPPSVQVSASQWDLLLQLRHPATPRAVAWQLGRSVFGTTADIYRLMSAGLVRTDPQPHE